MVAKIIALLEGLTTADLDATVPVHLERFSALCRHWASLADLRREVPNDGTLSDIKNGKRSE